MDRFYGFTEGVTQYSMKIIHCVITQRSNLSEPAAGMLELYIERAARYLPCSHRVFASEDKFLQFASAASGRTRPAIWLTDSRGQQISSDEMASALGTLQDNGAQQLIVSIGPADGWSLAALARADRTLAFGRITLPHELAAVVAAEQIYRALSIRAGHPYHSGH